MLGCGGPAELLRINMLHNLCLRGAMLKTSVITKCVVSVLRNCYMHVPLACLLTP